MPSTKKVSMAKRSNKTQKKRRAARNDDSDEYERAANVSLTSSSQDEMIPENTEELPMAEDSSSEKDEQFVDQKQTQHEQDHKDLSVEKPRLLEAMQTGAEENTEIGSHQTLSHQVKLGREEESKDDTTTKKSKNEISFYQRPKYIDTISPASQKQSLQLS